MKTTGSIFAKITLGLLIAGSIAACNNNKTADKAAPAATPASAGAVTAVYINTDSLISQYDYAKDMGKRLQDKGKNAQANIASKGQALQREYADYQKNVATMPADQRQQKEERLQREKQDFDTYQQRESADFQSEQGSETSKLYEKLADFSKAYAKEKGYKTVLTYSKTGPGVLYVDPSLDVTADVVKRLNDAYAKEKK